MDREGYAELLERHTRVVADTAGTRVAYAELTRDPDWPRLIASLEASDPDLLDDPRERLAFWIDAYNILAMDVVIRHYPMKSIRDAGSILRPVWKRVAGRIDGRRITLDEIEHRILRPMGEPRIHAAMVCASVSCPPLQREPWRADRMDAQLDAATRIRLADPRKGVRVEEARGILHLSPIFGWFPEDFAAAGGVIAFVARHAPEKVRSWLAARAQEPRLRDLDYDWGLNDLAAA